MNRINWTAVALFAIVGLLVILLGISLFGGLGMMGGFRSGMMGGWGFSPFGWIGMIFMLLIPVGFLVLIVLGVVWLIRAIGGETGAVSKIRSCPSCGRRVQPDWRNCPYCGTSLNQAS